MNPYKRFLYANARLEQWWYRAHRRAFRKILHPLTKSMKQLSAPPHPKGIGERLEISIWYRPLKPSMLRRIVSKSVSHWCIQVRTMGTCCGS